MATVLICGGRDFNNFPALDAVLQSLFTSIPDGITLIVHGGARGADAMAGQWAERWRIPVKVFPANWEGDGRAAGPIRNARMLAEAKPDYVVAMPGGKGTADMIRRSRAAGVKVLEH